MNRGQVGGGKLAACGILRAGTGEEEMCLRRSESVNCSVGEGSENFAPAKPSDLHHGESSSQTSQQARGVFAADENATPLGSATKE
jgi:hypothetical protein